MPYLRLSLQNGCKWLQASTPRASSSCGFETWKGPQLPEQFTSMVRLSETISRNVAGRPQFGHGPLSIHGETRFTVIYKDSTPAQDFVAPQGGIFTFGIQF